MTDSGISLDRLPGFESAEDGTRFQLTRLSAPGAAAVKARLANLRLPEGALLYVYGISESGGPERVQGPYQNSGPTSSGEFWTLAVRGEDVVIEVQLSGEPLATLPYDVLEIVAADLSEAAAAEKVDAAPAAVTGQGTAFYRGFNVEYEVKGGQAIIEGDIEIGPAESVEPARADAPSKGRQAIAISATSYRWPGGVMPYTIQSDMPNTYRITDAINHWNTQLAGVVKIVPRTNESTYATFKRPSSANTCSATVGYIRLAGQNINIGDNCSTGNTIHEIGHALGLYHEQSREDRDRFVSIQWDNILSTATYNFNQVNSSADDVGTYDYNSIMHYGAYAFSANGQPTIVTVPAGIPIGQRSGLSAGDVAGIRTIYQGSTATATTSPTSTTTATMISITLDSNPTGVSLTVDGASVRAPYTVSWAAGSSHTISAPKSVNLSGRKLRWSNWSNGGARNQTVTASSTTTMYVANYITALNVRGDVAVNGTGRVTVLPASEDGYYDLNSTVTLQATPAPGYCFAGWTGLLPGTPATTFVTVTAPVTAIANFVQGGGALQNASTSLVARLNGGHWRVGNLTSSCPMTISSSADWLAGSINGNNANIRVQPYQNGTQWYRSGTVTFGSHTVTVWQFKY